MFPSDASKYDLLEMIGSGGSADVYHAKCLSNGRHVAIKIIDLERETIDLNFVRQEVAFWSSWDHPNIVHYHGSFVAGHHLYILMEFLAVGSVSGILRDSFRNGFQDEATIATILRGIVRALVHIHAHAQIHRDIKPSNVLVGEDGSVKIGDFGIAATLLEDGQRRRARYTTIGTPCYMAPEMFQREAGHTEKADIWSLGITAMELAVGSAPHAGLNVGDIVPKILKAPPPQLPRGRPFSAEFRDFVKNCMNADPLRRLSAVQLLAHPFLGGEQLGRALIVQSIVTKLPPLYHRYQKRMALIMGQIQLPNSLQPVTTVHSKIEWSFQCDDGKKVQKGRFTILRHRCASSAP
jgi:serine/threonine-protein kinase OSR1/STK39